MTFTPEQITLLSHPLDKSVVATREKGGKRLSYVEAWHVIAEANRIFGFDGWTRETISLTETNRDMVELKGSNGPYSQWRVGYIAKVRVSAGGVVREGTGFGSGMSKPEALGDAVESAVKEAESDAMKRALMTFGNPFGLALYDKSHSNVGTVPTGPSPAAQFAADQLRSTKTKEEFSHFWNTQKAGLKETLSVEDYAHVIGIMKAEAARFADKPAPPPADEAFPGDNPFDQQEAA